jgi:hypothetical protein
MTPHPARRAGCCCLEVLIPLLAVLAAAVLLVVLAACGGTSTPAATPATSPPAATASPSPGGPQPTADDVACAQALVVAMRAGLDHSIINSADITAAQQQAEAGLTVCEPVITAHGEGLDQAVWTLTAQAGFPRSRWDQ